MRHSDEAERAALKGVVCQDVPTADTWDYDGENDVLSKLRADMIGLSLCANSPN